jgi:hypothetical protein
MLAINLPKWTPKDLDVDLRGWYDASDLTTITESGGSVSQWNDKSGSGHNLAQATGAEQPTTGTRSLNNKNVLDFDGGDKIFTNDSVMSGNPDVTIATVAIYDINNNPAEDRIMQLGDGGGQTVAITGGVVGYAFRFDDGNEVYGATSLATPIIQVGVRAAGSDYQSSQMFINGTESARTSGAGDTNTPNIGTGLSLGSGFTFSNPIDGVIGESIIVEDSTLATRQKIEGYLAHKWGLTSSLPPTHPYRYTTPLVSPWTPAEIATDLWLDAADDNTITEAGGSVSQWDDKSGNGNHATQPTGAAQPTLSGTQLNFSTTHIFRVTNDPFNGMQNPCVIVVGRWDIASSWGNVFVSYDGEPVGWQLRQRSFDFDQLTFSCRGTAGTDDPTPTSTTNTSFFIGSAYRKDSDTRIIRHNGTETYIDATDTGTISYGSSNRSAIGGRFLGDNWTLPEGYLRGAIKEIIVVDGLSDDDIQKLEGYLAHKWHLKDALDATHPYKHNYPIINS